MHPYYHTESSVRKHGGTNEDYLPLHNWFNASKELYADFRHRAVRHHAQGIFEAERVFGVTIRNSDGKEIPVRVLGEQHVKEDCGWIPSIQDWLKNIKGERWMISPGRRHDDPSDEVEA